MEAAPRAAVLVYRPAGVSAAGDRRQAPAPEEVAQELRQALAERAIKPVEDAIQQGLRVHGERQGRALQGKVGAVRDLLREGRQALSQVELERADALLDQAEKDLRGLLVLAEAPGLYAEVLRWRGVVQMELGRSAAAEDSFCRALALAPAVRLTEADVRPDVVRAFERAAGRVAGRVALTLVPLLQGAPLPAALLPSVVLVVDGGEVPLGRAHGQIAAEVPVALGEHVVVLRAPGYRTLVKMLRVPGPGEPASDGPVEVSLDLAPDPLETDLLGLRRGPTPEGLRALCTALELDHVVVASAVQDLGQLVLGGQRYACDQGVLEQEVLVRGSGPLAAVGEQLIGRLWGPAAGRASAGLSWLGAAAFVHPRATPLPPHPPRPLYKQPWLWVGIGVLTVGTVLAATLWPRPSPHSTVVVDPGQFALTWR